MNELEAQLKRMPKPPVADVVTSVAAQAKAVLLAAGAMLLFGGVCYGISLLVSWKDPWQITAGISSALSMTPLLTGALMALWVYVQGGKRRQLAAGEYYVHWSYEPNQWAQHCDRLELRYSRALQIFVACGLGIGLVFAAMVHFDDDRLFFGSIVTHYGVCIGIGAIAGWVIGLFCRYLGNITRTIQRDRTAQSLIGPEGVYVTGQFWPTRTFGHNLRSASVGGGASTNVRFVFAVQTNHGTSETTVVIPIPLGQEKVAAALAKVMMED